MGSWSETWGNSSCMRWSTMVVDYRVRATLKIKRIKETPGRKVEHLPISSTKETNEKQTTICICVCILLYNNNRRLRMPRRSIIEYKLDYARLKNKKIVMIIIVIIKNLKNPRERKLEFWRVSFHLFLSHFSPISLQLICNSEAKDFFFYPCISFFLSYPA